MRGWGYTELSIRCDLKDGKNNLVSTATSSREIVGGGLYTVVAWETIFDDVANDVAGDLKDQIETQGYVIKPKTQAQAITSAKEIEQTAPATEQTQKAPKLASIPKKTPIVRVGLRRQPLKISNQMHVTDMLLEYDFFDRYRNAHGAFVNDFIDNNDGTVTDKATDLMWQRGGSYESLDNRSAKKYVKQLKRKGFAGYSDWRMPTVEELASLLVRRRKDGVHLATVFESHQTSCWSADKSSVPYDQVYYGYWIINFKQGQVHEAWFHKPSITVNWPATQSKNETNYVKAVRTVRYQ